MTDNTGSTDGQAPDDDEPPLYLPPGGPDSVPGFSDRLLAHLAAGVDEPEFTFEDVEVEEAGGVWLVPLGGYDPAEDRTLTHGEPADRPLPPGGYGQLASTSAEDVRRALNVTWGEPQLRTPRLVGVSQEPEGLLDYMMLAVGFEEAETWDRGEFVCALVTGWDDAPGTSVLRQVMIVLPREFAYGGMAAVASDEITVHDLLMHGEHPLELRRRAWLMSAIYGQGEVRVRGTAVEASRFGLRRKDGTTSVWAFADDGRILVLMRDPACEFVTTAADQLIADQLAAGSHPDDPERVDPDRAAADAALREEAELILIARLIDGVPEDLRELIAAPAETEQGHPAEHELEFRMLSGRPMPIISGLAWYDGEHWRIPVSLLEIGSLSDLGMDDFGFAEAVRRPYRLGGPFTADRFVRADSLGRATFDRVFAACPYPEQDRPSDDQRLGYGLPTGVTHDDIVGQIERAAEVWWDIDPGQSDPVHSDPDDHPFRIGGRNLRVLDGRILRSVIAVAEPWTVDVLRTWVDGLTAAMTDRWGAPLMITGIDSLTGLERRSPVARVMRGTGLMNAPLWWVDGLAVLLLAGAPNASYDDEPQAILLIARVDAVLDVMRGTRLLELRRRARLLTTLCSFTRGTPVPEDIPWDGPPLEETDGPPPAVRGRLRTGDFAWVWHFTHDGRALLLSFPLEPDTVMPTFTEQLGLFSGLPDDLLSLVVDRDPNGLFPVVLREDVASDEDIAPDLGLLDGARALPAAAAVLWFDQYDWRASDAMLRRSRPSRSPGAASGELPESVATNPYSALISPEYGVGQLLWTWCAGRALPPDLLADRDDAPYVFGRLPEPDEVKQTFALLGDVHERALTGSLNQFLDVAVDSPGRRYVLDAALSNPNPQHRRGIALYLLERDVDASVQLSHLTPINVLFENPTLGSEDLPVLQRLLAAGARRGLGLGGPGVARHPLVQLAERDLDESELAPLVEALLEGGDPEELSQPVLPDGRSVVDLVAGEFPHGRSRAWLSARVREARG